jgi:hypothetical protein
MPFDLHIPRVFTSAGVRMFAPIASGVYESRMLASGSTSEKPVTYKVRSLLNPRIFIRRR